MKRCIALIIAIVFVLTGLPAITLAISDNSEIIGDIQIISPLSQLQPGQNAQLEVKVLDKDGNNYAGELMYGFTSINPFAASVDATGFITANHVGSTKIIVTVTGLNNALSKTLFMLVTEAGEGESLTFENTAVGSLPSQVTTTSLGMTGVTDARGSQSSKSVYVNDTSSTKTADLSYKTAAAKTKTLDFDVYPENKDFGIKILNNSNYNGYTAFWIAFSSSLKQIRYYNGTSWVTVSSKFLKMNAWNRVHIEITNTDKTTGTARVYIDGVEAGVCYKTTLAGTSYGGSTTTTVNTALFASGGNADTGSRFYVDNLSFKDGLNPLPPPLDPSSDVLKVTQGELFYLADNSADMTQFCQIPFVYATPEGNKIYVSYSRHRDTYLDHPEDSVLIADDTTNLGSASFTQRIDSQDVSITSMAKLPDGRTFATTYINYYETPTSAKTIGWIIDQNNEWTKIEGTLTWPESISDPIPGSNWYKIVFSRGILVLDDGTILCTVYGMGGSSLIRSTDIGKTWEFVSTIARNDGTMFNIDGSLMNFQEPSLVRCQDGSLLSILRTDSNKPLYQSRSLDNGITWSKPTLLPGIDPSVAQSINPGTVLLDNDVLVLTTGRPNNTLLFSLDGSGYKWGYACTTMAGTTTGNSSVARIGTNKLMVVGDTGFVNNAVAKVWGTIVDLARNIDPNPVLDNALITFNEPNIVPIGKPLKVNMAGIFDSNQNKIDTSLCDINYYSENPEIAVVSETGEVVGNAEGIARITASVTYNGMTVMSNTLEIKVFDELKLSSFSASVDTLSLYPAQSTQILTVAYNTIGGAITGAVYSFTSNNEAVVNVSSDGIITAIAPGEATISVIAIKDGIKIEKPLTVMVKSGLWAFENFDSIAVGDILPVGFSKSNSIGVISDIEAYSKNNSLYIRDDLTNAIPNVLYSFTPGKGAIVEFMLYPELIEHTAVVAIGDGASAAANEVCSIGFFTALAGKPEMIIRAYNGKSWIGIIPESPVLLNQWNKVRIEATVDSPSKIFVNDTYVADVPFCSTTLTKLSRVRFSTGGTGYINDHYYIDNLRVASLSQTPEDLKLEFVKVNGYTFNAFDNDTVNYIYYVVPANKAPIVEASPLSSDAIVKIQQAESSSGIATITISKGNQLVEYKIAFQKYRGINSSEFIRNPHDQ